MKHAKIIKPFSMKIEETDMPDVSPNDVRVKVMASGICGTDVHIYKGEYLGGYPVVPGHEFSGIVDAVGSEVSRYKPGDRVAVEPNVTCNNCYNCLNNRQNFCLNWIAIGVTHPGSMAQYAVIPENAVFSIGDLSFEQGAFMEPLSCVIHGIRKANIAIGDKVAVIGAGPIGNLMLKLLKTMATVEITVAERDPHRRRRAEKNGADICLSDLSELKDTFYDVVIDATGVPSVMETTLQYVRKGGTVLLFGVPPMDSEMTLKPFTIFEKGLTVLSSFTSVRNSYRAVDLLQTGRIDVSDIISHRLPLEEFEHGIQLIEEKKENVEKVLIMPNGGV